MDTLETSDLVDGLIRIGETLGSSDPIDVQMHTLCEAVTSILRCDSAGIMLRDGDYLYGKYSFGHPDDLVDLVPLFRIKVGAPLVQRAIQSGSYIVINNAKSDPDASSLADLARISALVLAPIVHPNGSPLAIMAAHYIEEIGKFDETRGQLVLGASKMAQLALLADRERVTRIRTMASRRELVGELTQSENAERSRISREIHDDSMQRVLALRLKLSALSNRTRDPETQRALEDLAEQGASTAQSLRNLLQNLHPRDLDNDGLGVALEEALTRTAVGTGWDFTVKNELEVEPSRDTATVLYRAALAAFTSLETHSNATRVDVRLATVKRGTELLATTDGRGFANSAVQSGRAVVDSMRKRVEHTGGVLELESDDDTGTMMRIWIPIQIVDRSRH